MRQATAGAVATRLQETQQPSILVDVKVTFDLDPDLYRTIKVEAARTDRSVRDVIEEALAAWLEAAEEVEDRTSAQAALDEYRRDGGEAAEAWFGRLAAETRATYAPSEE
jgi:plasmid stability protein